MLDPEERHLSAEIPADARERRPRETDQQIEERLKEQIRTQHLEQLLGTSAIEAETYRQRLPHMLATRRPEETEQDIERRLTSQVMPPRFFGQLGQPMGVGGKEIQIEGMPGISGRIEPMAIATPGSTNCVTTCWPKGASSVSPGSV